MRARLRLLFFPPSLFPLSLFYFASSLYFLIFPSLFHFSNMALQYSIIILLLFLKFVTYIVARDEDDDECCKETHMVDSKSSSSSMDLGSDDPPLSRQPSPWIYIVSS
ncbi:hypothetical protein BX666DRAFT_1985575 [Dichotomocladium elegans]|nr:hypothetical protein BX666DRAFT_1985575 [Dichotomocladium elegans]